MIFLIGPHFSQTKLWLFLARNDLIYGEEVRAPTPCIFSAKRLITAYSIVLTVHAEFHSSG
jgi:hypothetical protein